MKKYLSVLIAILLTFSSCSVMPRTGYKKLSDRLAEYNQNYAFEYLDLFIFEHTYHTYISLCSEQDALLSMNIDEKGDVDSVTVTAYKNNFNSSNEKNILCDYFNALVNCYTSLSDKEYEELNNNLNYNKPKTYFSNLYQTYSSKRYNFIFSSNSEFVFLSCEYYEEPELVSG